MKLCRLAAAFLASLVLFFPSCSQPLAGSGAAGTPRTGGSLEVSLPSVAQALVRNPAGGRAFLHAAKATVAVQEKSGDGANWIDVVPVAALTAKKNEYGNLVVSGEVKDIPPGQGYRVVVDLWAHADDPEPSVRGICEDVSVWAGNSNSVWVNCQPLHPEVVDLTDSDPARPFELSTRTLAAGGETWIALKLKPRVRYSLEFTSTGGALGFGFSSRGGWWNLSSSDQTYSPDASSAVYLGISGADTSGTFGFKVTQRQGSLVEVTGTYPGTNQGGQYQFTLVSDRQSIIERSNNYLWRDGKIDYWVPSLSAGIYSVTAKLEGSASLSGSAWRASPVAIGDFFLRLPMISVNGTDPVKIELTKSQWEPVTSTVSGTVTIPDGTMVPSYVPVYAYLDNDTDFGNGVVAESVLPVQNGKVQYGFANVPAGTYSLTVLVARNGSFAQGTRPQPNDLMAQSGVTVKGTGAEVFDLKGVLVTE